MINLYTDGSSFFEISEDGVQRVDCDWPHINKVMLVTEDTNILYGHGEDKKEIKAKAGQVIVTIYNNSTYGPNKIFAIDSKEFVENILSYREYMKKQEEATNIKDCDSAS